MMYYLESSSYDPSFNLALEQYVFDHLDRRHAYFMLWQNHNTIVVGKHQNTVGEINAAFVKEHNINVVRRLSGGGAVYHDMGNINFTFVADHEGSSFDFSTFCKPVVSALSSIGVTAQISGRNDMTIDGRKFSGNSQYMRQGRTMHHGTIMYDSDLSVLSQALAVSPDKIQSKGFQSVRSRVTNVRPHVQANYDTPAFYDILRQCVCGEYQAQPLHQDAIDWQEVQRLRDSQYHTWEWNYGHSPAFSLQRKRRIENVGQIELYLQVDNGIIGDTAFFGDYFGNGNTHELSSVLQNIPLREDALTQALSHVDIGYYFHGLTRENLVALITGA